MSGRGAPRAMQKTARVVAVVTASLAMGACAQGLGGEEGASVLGALNAGSQDADTPTEAAGNTPAYWSKEYSKNPRDLDTALAFANSLKAAGDKAKGLTVLQEASLHHGSDRKLASEYGRLALELDHVSLAKRLLTAADDPANPDWRVIMARGTVLAKEGKYSEAIPFFSRALVLEPDHPSIMNNLALAYTMSGEPAKAEELLRRAADAQGSSAKVRQNLALVLAIQGKYDESTIVGTEAAGPAVAQTDVNLLKKMVKLEPKPLVEVGALDDAWEMPGADTDAAIRQTVTDLEITSSDSGKIAAVPARSETR